MGAHPWSLMSASPPRADITCRSFLIWTEQRPLADNHLAVQHDRQVNAGEALGIGSVVPGHGGNSRFSNLIVAVKLNLDRRNRRCMFVGWRPASIGLKTTAVPSAKRPALPSFRRWITLSIYGWIAFPKALGLSKPCTASPFTAPRAMSRWTPNERVIMRIRRCTDGQRVHESEHFFDARRSAAGSMRGI